MPITNDDFKAIIAGASENPFQVHLKAKQAQEQAQEQAKLAALLKGQEATAERARQMQSLEDLRQKYPGQDAYDVGDISMHSPGTSGLKIQLTPAQETAERTYGKQLTDYETAGGKPAMEKNLKALQEVKQHLESGKRGKMDRLAGALFGTSPGMMGVLASGEKAVRDKARNTALTIARQTDPNPTEKQIEAIMGQIYDPASSTEDNLSRINRFLDEQTQKAQQLEGAAQRYKQSGYATMRSPGRPLATPPPAAKVRVTNGTETLEIDAADVPNAQADGYKVVR